MSENQEQEIGRLVASVTVVLPNAKIGGQIKRGKAYLAGQTIPLDEVSDDWVDNALDRGIVRFENDRPIRRRDVEALEPTVKLNVSATGEGANEDNPLDKGIDVVPGAGTDDPALDAALEEIAAEQAEAGIENSSSSGLEIEINAETGERSESGGEEEADVDEEADAQVS